MPRLFELDFLTIVIGKKKILLQPSNEVTDRGDIIKPLNIPSSSRPWPHTLREAPPSSVH